MCIFKDFLFRDFVFKFRRIFDLPKNKKLQHTSFKWCDQEYSEFMINILKNLEPRFLKENEMICEELQLVMETIFLMKGCYIVGYEINKKRKYKLQFREGS